MLWESLVDYVVSSLLDKHKDKLPDQLVNFLEKDESFHGLLQAEIIPRSLESLKANYPELQRDDLFVERVLAPAIAHLILNTTSSGKLVNDDALQQKWNEQVNYDITREQQLRFHGIMKDYLEHFCRELAKHQEPGTALLMHTLGNLRQEIVSKLDSVTSVMDTSALGGTLDDNYLLPALPENFISRSSLLRTVYDLFSSENKTVAITGPDGAGKTTFLREFLHAHQDKCFYFTVGRDLTSNTHNFLRELSQQMQRVIEPKPKPLADASYDELKIYFFRLCRSVARQSKRQHSPYFLVVDGLEHTDEQVTGDKIVDLLPHDTDGELYVLLSSRPNQTFPFQYLSYVLPFFSHAETYMYLRSFEVDEDRAANIYSICGGMPGYLHQLTREIQAGYDIAQTLMDLPKGFEELLYREWQKDQPRSGNQLRTLAILAFSNLSLDLGQLSSILKIDVDTTQKSLQLEPTIELNDQGLVTFITDAHRNFVAGQVVDYKESAYDLLIDYYQERPHTDPSISNLPLLLFRKKDQYDSLRQLINIDHLQETLQVKKDLFFLRRNVNLVLEQAYELDDKTTLAKFALMSSLLRSFAREAIGRSEIEALLSLGNYQLALHSVYRARLPEDRLQLLALIGKYLRRHRVPLIDGIIDELVSLVHNIVHTKNLEDRAIEIATDLFYVHPQSALQLVRKVAGPDGQGQSIDILLTALALSIEEEASTFGESAASDATSSISTKTLKSEIQDENLRSFVSAHSYTFSSLSPLEIIAESETLHEVSAKLFLLRSWCNAHRSDPSAIAVVDEAVHTISMADIQDYALPMLHLRQFAQPLLACENTKAVSELILKLDELKSTALKQPVEESIYYELVAAAVEYKNSPLDAHTRLIDVYTEELDEIEDLDLRCYCLARILAFLPKIDPDNELNLYREIEEGIISSYQVLLNASAEHYEISKRLLGVLVSCNPDVALDFAKQINTRDRRDKALGEMLRVYVTDKSCGLKIDLVQSLLDLIVDPRFRDQTLVKILGVSAFQRTISEFPDLEDLFNRVDTIIEPVDQAYAYAYILKLLASGPKQEMTEVFQQMFASWSRIDTQWNKVDIGFDLVSLIAEVDLELAKELFEAVKEEKLQSPLSEGLVAELYINTLGIIIRTFSDSIKGDDYRAKHNELVKLIEQIPSCSVRVSLLGDLALRLHLGNKTADAEEIIDSRIHAELESCPDDHTFAHAVIEIAPCLYERDQEFFKDPGLIARLTYREYDALLAQLIRYIITKQPLSNPVDLSKKSYKVRALIDARKICRLIEHSGNDYFLYETISTLVDALIEPDHQRPGQEKGTLDERQLLEVAKRLTEIIKSKLPDKKNIQHEGYVVACQSEVARLRAAATKRSPQWKPLVPSWEDIARSAAHIPNAADQVFVSTIVATNAHKDQPGLASHLIHRAEEILNTPGAIPNACDRQERYTSIAQAWFRIDNKQAAEKVLRDAWHIINGLYWDETKDEVAGEILELAHSISPELAGSLANAVENPVVRRTLVHDNQIKALVNNPQSIGSVYRQLENDALKFSAEDLGLSAYKITKQLCSGEGTISEASIPEWIYRTADTPFRVAHSVGTMAIQNQLVQQHRLNSPTLNQVYLDLLDCLKLVYWVGSTLFADIADNGSGSEQNVAVPSNLETAPVKNHEELTGKIKEWLLKNTAGSLVLCNSRFNQTSLDVLQPLAGHTDTVVLTSWKAQDFEHREFQQLQDTYRQASNEKRLLGSNIRIYILEDNTGEFPITSEFYILDGKLGLEILQPTNSLDRAYAYTRTMSREEVNTLFDDLSSLFSLRPSYKDTVLRSPYIIQL